MSPYIKKESLCLDSIFLYLDAFLTDHNQLPDVIVPEVHLEQLSIGFAELVIPDVAFYDLTQVPYHHVIAKPAHNVLLS